VIAAGERIGRAQLTFEHIVALQLCKSFYCETYLGRGVAQGGA